MEYESMYAHANVDADANTDTCQPLKDVVSVMEEKGVGDK